MATYSPGPEKDPDNKRTSYLNQTLDSLADTIDFRHHSLYVTANAVNSEAESVLIYWEKAGIITHVIWNDTNTGTAYAINQAWAYRKPGEHAIKMDDDVVIHSSGWVNILEECIERDPSIGICGLKRKDCAEHPDSQNAWYKSRVYMLPQQPGQRWLICEEVQHVMGTCQMFSSALLDKMGYMVQPRQYGFDDALAAVRCKVAGFKSVFYRAIEIDHIDDGQSPYQQWKHKVSGEDMAAYQQMVQEYISGKRPVYYNPFQ